MDQLLVISNASISGILDCYSNGGGTECIYKFDALGGLILLYIAFVVYCFVFAEVTGNYSKVDQIWSLTPIWYAWFAYAHWGHNNVGTGSHDRLFLVCSLITLWGGRLTYNFWRRDGYGNLITHEEDYRWPILRKIINNKFLFTIFNATFISTYQNLILLLIALPAYHVMKSEKDINNFDIYLTILFLALFIMETIADQQHWNFQNKKYACTPEQREVHPDKDVVDGFYRQGLFRYCRHPNYFAEQATWVTIYLFTLSHTNITSITDICNIYFLGAFLLISLFQGSMAFSEGITASKYPVYKQYQKDVSQCIPFFNNENNDKKRI